MRLKPLILPALAFALLSTALFLIYLPALNAGFLFDSEQTLSGLAQADDTLSSLNYVTQGEAGPLGRPIALASFLLNKDDWPGNPAGIRTINVLVHIVNFFLLTLLVAKTGSLRGQSPSKIWEIAFFVGAIWAFMPLLATSNLLSSQRMTTLSATFTLASLIGFVSGLNWLDKRRTRAAIYISLSLAVGTALAMLSKENGVLTPVYALALLILIPASKQPPRGWTCTFLIAPTLAIVGYLLWITSPDNFANRAFSLSERLLTQPIILWEYLGRALLPSASKLGPFHDDHPFFSSLSAPQALAAASAWLGMVAVAIKYRQRAPWLSFSVAWFLGGHLVESTSVSLELYFEHRNYLPIIGPVYALVATINRGLSSSPLLARLVLVAYIMATGFVLWLTTSLWGQPYTAALEWHKSHPRSVRANQFLVQQYLSNGQGGFASIIINNTYLNNPHSLDLALQRVLISCQLGENGKSAAYLQKLLASPDSFEHTNGALGNLPDIVSAASVGECVKPDDILALTTKLLAAPGFNHRKSLEHILPARASAYLMLDDQHKAIETYQRAFDTTQKPIFALLVHSILRSQGHHCRADAYLQQLLKKPPGDSAMSRLAATKQIREELTRARKIAGLDSNCG